LKWLHRGVPLLFGAIHNRRSLVALENPSTCRDLRRASGGAGQTLLVSDGEDLSTTEPLRRPAAALGKRAARARSGASVLRAARALGLGSIAQRVWKPGVDSAPTRRLLGWAPPLSVDEGLRVAAEAYLREARG
jgi:UDP-glucose 4-epimerase